MKQFQSKEPNSAKGDDVDKARQKHEKKNHNTNVGDLNNDFFIIE